MVECKVCGKQFDSDKQLHGHLKAHKLRMAEYYQTYWPRYDKYDNSIIKFKNKDYYLNTDFNSRTNLRMWLKNCGEEVGKKYCRELLVKRKQRRSLIYTPTQVELRSVMSPPINYYDKIFGDYYGLCEELGYKNKHKKFNEIISGSVYDKNEYFIYVDTRERVPLRFKNIDIEVKKLDFGDYAFSDAKASCNTYIERKALNDFIGTLSGGYDRFVKEIERAKEAEAYLVVLVESKFTDALYFNQARRRDGKKLYSQIKATPEYIFHNVRHLCQEYPFVQFLFVNGREEAKRVMEKIFKCGCAHKEIDLQLAYDNKYL
tara:strand:- start:11913 stop:12863 length:951 start_codon:yes stop_codon:yes gene_type:complete